jgi:3-oxoacyl-[acyl-carrier-protein] synthase-3
MVIEAVDGPGQLLSFDMGNDGTAIELLYCDIGDHLKMVGKEVFRRAVTVMVDSARRSMDRAGVTADDIALVVPHQANIRIIEAAASRLGLSMDTVAVSIHRYGNTSSASIPLAMVDAIDEGRVKAGDLVLLVGFGAGTSWASAVLRWPGTNERTTT